MCPLFLVFKLKKMNAINTTTTNMPTNNMPTTSTAAAIGGKVLIVLSIIQIVAFHIYEMKKLSP